MPFVMTRHILEAYMTYGYFGLMVTGPLRSGKSSYSIQLLAEVYGILEHPRWKHSLSLSLEDWATWVFDETTPDWDAWRTWMVYTPEEFVNKIRETNVKQRCLLVWDDAGVWLSCYEYHHPFLKELNKYMNVLATDWASVVFTTPHKKWLLTHVRDLPGGHSGRVTKVTGNPYAQDYRYMKVYEGWMSPDMKKRGVTTIFRDNFRTTLPNRVFAEYDSYRRQYTTIVKDRLLETLHTVAASYGSKFADKKREQFEKLGIKL